MIITKKNMEEIQDMTAIGEKKRKKGEKCKLKIDRKVQIEKGNNSPSGKRK